MGDKSRGSVNRMFTLTDNFVEHMINKYGIIAFMLWICCLLDLIVGCFVPLFEIAVNINALS